MAVRQKLWKLLSSLSCPEFTGNKKRDQADL